MSPSLSLAASQVSKKNIDMSPTEEIELTVENTEIISVDGDLVLQIEDTIEGHSIYYRVSSVILKRTSTYFDKLLDPTKFSEGEKVGRMLTVLRKSYPDWSAVPASILPKVSISYVGQFPKGVSNRATLRTFFEILSFPTERPPELPHTLFVMLSSPNERAADLSRTLSMALLAVVADRFGAIDSISRYINREAAPLAPSVKEEVLRQRLLIGLMFNIDNWTIRYSAQLILAGSQRWTFNETDPQESDDPLWWNLPGGVEEELAYRRECIQSTISSLQSCFLDLYASKQRQCKLGYDSSPQCDSFQLGEMIRFFTKNGTLKLQSSIIGQDYTSSYHGNLRKLIGLLKQCPEYQIDENHTHCGLRTRVMPALEFLESMIRAKLIGICTECWKNDKRQYSWLENPIEGTWCFRGAPRDYRLEIAEDACRNRHSLIKEIFTADRREWTLQAYDRGAEDERFLASKRRLNREIRDVSRIGTGQV